jgi:hypothetical protein
MSGQSPRPFSVDRRIIGLLQMKMYGNLDLVSYCDYRFHFPVHMIGDRGWTPSPDFISPQALISGETPTPTSPLTGSAEKWQLGMCSKWSLTSYREYRFSLPPRSFQVWDWERSHLVIPSQYSASLPPLSPSSLLLHIFIMKLSYYMY